MKKLFKPVIIAAAAAMALSATAFAADNFAYSLNIDGKATDTDVLVLVPLRETAENLGFKVLWNNDGTILVDDGVMHSYITIGKNDYIVSTSVDDMVGTSAPFSLSSAPIISGGKTYVPVEFFRPLMGNSDDIIKTDGSVISISKNVVSIPEKENERENAQIPNTFTEHETLEELEKTVAFDVTLPSFENSYKATDFIDINRETADIRFSDGKNEITFRKAKGTEDISGDYNTYSLNKTIKVKNTDVKVRGNNGVNTATWQKDGFTYSLSFETAISEADLAKCIENIL